ncbi:hypothetical protein HIM_01789 [Hirsutella minnesotensis 3608]|nr:hypothetical protein HIM_01789 [Hirsutella minnesotensis 3608]
MAIRDRIRRALRKSDSSETFSHTGSNTTSTSTSNSTSATTTSETSSLRKTATTASTLSRVFAFGSRDKDPARRSQEKAEKAARRERRRAARPGKKPIHPSQRPLTLQNLKHQEMLSHFTMTFGATDPHQIESLSFCGVSPCCTRANSIDLDREDPGEGFASLSIQDSAGAAEPSLHP